MGMGKQKETEKLSMTLTTVSIDWLHDTYPEAQSTQEAVRMAISDARKHNLGVANISMCSDDE